MMSHWWSMFSTLDANDKAIVTVGAIIAMAAYILFAIWLYRRAARVRKSPSILREKEVKNP